ncbi:hypothetical protein [uncultured Psychroserpens sp.]|uniref:hypothetical protein n=1 Tax=uncultured Psychroserpens sp. TaxID=255436 RepID=UPI00261EBB1D|nr:hypothetical protein [uncultured Psychroserpens sp.]
MTLKIKYLLIIILLCNYSNSQNLVIETPTFESPENKYFKIYEEDKIYNPIYLNGNVKTVERKYEQHSSIYGNIAKDTKIYMYKLNDSKQIISYVSSNEYDDKTIESFNIKNEFTTKKDTIINQDITEYTFKKGLLTLEKETDRFHGSIDSIVYNYNHYNKLIEIKHYQSYGIHKTDENGNVDENNIVFDEFEIKVFEKVTYNDSNNLIEKNKYIIGYDIIEHYRTSYLYNDVNQLKTDEKVFKKYHRDYNNEQGDNPINWYLKEINLTDYNPLSWKTTYEYDNKNRIIKYVETFVQDYGKKEQFVWENGNCTIDYDDKLHVRTINTITTKKSSSTSEPKIRELNYEYFFDDLNNPVKILNYIVQFNEKILDKSTILNITYF